MNIKPSISQAPRLAAAISVMALCWPLMAAADCVDGVRKPTGPELEFHSRGMAALVAALPPAPPGVKLAGTPPDFSRLPAIGVLCKEQKEGDFVLEASRTYLLELSGDEFKRRRAERTALSDQLYALTLLPPDLKAQRDALQQQASAGYAATDAARKAGDQAGARARETEANGYSQQARELQKKHEEAMKSQADEIRRRQEAIDIEGQKATVRLAINATRLPGGSSAIPSAAYGAASPGKSAGLKVHNVVWGVAGAETPLRQALAGAIDRARLQSLVGKALPSPSESEAFAAKAAPVSVPDLQPPAQAPVSAPAATLPPIGGPAPSPGVAGLPGTARQATDAVNQLRGLLGR